MQLLGLQQKAQFLEVRKTVHGINCTVLQQIEEDGCPAAFKKGLLLHRKDWVGVIMLVHVANIEHVYGKTSTITFCGLLLADGL